MSIDIVTEELVKLWFDNIKICQACYRDEETYLIAVDRLLASIVDTQKCPFKQIVDEKYQRLMAKSDRLLDIWRGHFPHESRYQEDCSAKEKEIAMLIGEELVNFIVRLIAEKVY